MREEDIRPRALLNEYLRLSAEDAERFFPDPALLERDVCPGCGSEQAEAKFIKNGFSYVACTACRTLYANPRPTPDQLSAFYRDSRSARFWAKTFFPAVAEVRRREIFAPRAARALALAQEFGPPPQTVVDVGAGIGLFLHELQRLAPALHLRAVEPGLDAAESCRDIGIKVYEGFADEAARQPGWAASADLATCFEVIEHLAVPEHLVRALGALVRPGGLVLVSGLCGDGFDIQQLGEKSNAVSPPHHLTFLSQAGVRAMVARAGLQLLSFETPGKLDVEIVRKALLADDALISDPDLRHLLLDADEAARVEFQASLVDAKKSSHMWFLARRPA